MNTAVIDRPKARRNNGQAASLPLRNGEHLSRAEFERRWDATPGLSRAELVEGIGVMPHLTSETHSGHHEQLQYWLSHYARATAGVKALIGPSLRLDNKNEFQPDCLLRIEAPVRRSSVSSDDYVEGSPELVAEVAVTSADYDAHEKREFYERAGVQEYFLWQVLDVRCDWWTLHEGAYLPLKPRSDGVHCSQVFPGLWLDLKALLEGDERKVRATLEKGLRSSEHAAVIRKLAAK